MNPNELSLEIQDSVRLVADAILASPQAGAYQSAVDALENDARAAALEKDFMALYADLIARQQKGELLSQQDLAPFYAMRSEYYVHPLVNARNDALGAFKPVLADAADQISLQLGRSFTELARNE